MKKKAIFYTILVISVFGIFRFADYLFLLLKVSGEEVLIKYPPSSEFISSTSEFVYLVETNSLGIRNKEIAEKLKPRILFLGDSFIYGVGVEAEDTMVRLVSDELNKNKFDFEVVNAGILGTCPKQAYRLYQDLSENVKADFVILNVYTNDVYESGEGIIEKKSWEQFIERKKWLKILYIIFPNSVRSVLKFYRARYLSKVQTDSESTRRLTEKYDKKNKLKYIHKLPSQNDVNLAVSTFLSSTQFLGQSIGLKPEQFEIWKENLGEELIRELALGRLSTNHALLGLYEPNYYNNSIELNYEVDENVTVLIDSLEKFRKTLSDQKIKLIVNYIPSELQYDKNKQKIYAKLGYHVKERWLTETSALEIKLADYCKKNRIPFLSMTESFRKHANDKLTWAFDIHWNEKGNRVAAKTLSDFLQSIILTEGSK